MTFLAAAWAKVGTASAGLIAVMVAGLAILRAARRAGRIEAEKDSLQQSLDATRRANEAAADYRSDGASKRLRDGTY